MKYTLDSLIVLCLFAFVACEKAEPDTINTKYLPGKWVPYQIHSYYINGYGQEVDTTFALPSDKVLDTLLVNRDGTAIFKSGDQESRWHYGASEKTVFFEPDIYNDTQRVHFYYKVTSLEKKSLCLRLLPKESVYVIGSEWIYYRKIKK